MISLEHRDMMCIKTKARPSSIHGLGWFAEEFIAKGTVVWRFVPGFDVAMTEAELAQLPQPAKEYMAVYAFRSTVTDNYILCSDDAKYENHSDTPNLDSVYVEGEEETVCIANRDIQKGEELTGDYRLFEKDWNGVP